MAKMVPDLPAQIIQNDGERMFYLACRDLPDEHTVFYSYKYRLEVPHGREDFQAIGEADFVVVHPELGYVVFEVKQGNIMYANGRWHEFKPAPSGARRSEHHTEPMAKDPVEQAQRAMWAILERYKQKSDESRFPLHTSDSLCVSRKPRRSQETCPTTLNRKAFSCTTTSKILIHTSGRSSPNT